MTNFNKDNNDKEYLYHPVPGETTRQTLERNYYKYVEPKNKITQMQIKNANNYAWDNSDPYDRRSNVVAIYNNFKKINAENPIIPPSSTGNKITDTVVMNGIGKRYPKIAAMIKAYNAGYIGAGYFDNLKQAYRESHRNDSILFKDENNY